MPLERVKEMFEIQKILFDNDICVEPKEIVTCSINNEQVGYGISMEKAIPAGETPPMDSPEMITWWRSFRKIINENDIVLSRRIWTSERSWKRKKNWTKRKLRKELIPHNLIATRNGYRLIDLGELFFN